MAAVDQKVGKNQPQQSDKKKQEKQQQQQADKKKQEKQQQQQKKDQKKETPPSLDDCYIRFGGKRLNRKYIMGYTLMIEEQQHGEPSMAIRPRVEVLLAECPGNPYFIMDEEAVEFGAAMGEAEWVQDMRNIIKKQMETLSAKEHAPPTMKEASIFGDVDNTSLGSNY